jgi:hypothetical protein
MLLFVHLNSNSKEMEQAVTAIKKISVLKVKQWMPTWDNMTNIDEKEGKAPSHFYLASMALKDLRALAGVSTRELEERKRANSKAGYQRAHEPERSEKIARYVEYGYPLSTQKNLDPSIETDIIHPGWLPTAILVNLIPAADTRRRHGKDMAISPDFVVSLEESSEGIKLLYPHPDEVKDDTWTKSLQPIEVIDGQHRLYAVDHITGMTDDYEVPVVIFDNLSPALQAYLFWVINVEPKKINPSLAFDLYPELRRQSWLEQGEGIRVYQEHRAQELTEILWRHESSPWQGRIELHGARVDGHVSNAAFIRSLMASFVRRWRSEDDKIGGLFGSIVDKSKSSAETERVLPWKRTQQAAFLIHMWRQLNAGVTNSDAEWVRSCRANQPSQQQKSNAKKLDPGFAGPHTLIATDQGSRALMALINAMFFVRYSELNLEAWESDHPSDNIIDTDVSRCIAELEGMKDVTRYLEGISAALFYGDFDWRTSSAPDLANDPMKKMAQSAYRGSSGYRLLQEHALALLEKATMPMVSEAAKEVRSRLRW